MIITTDEHGLEIGNKIIINFPYGKRTLFMRCFHFITFRKFDKYTYSIVSIDSPTTFTVNRGKYANLDINAAISSMVKNQSSLEK